MSEQLIIRLASEAEQQIHWLIWSASEREIIGSGEVDNAMALAQLTEKAQSRQVICLLPSVDVTLKAVTINGSFNRQMQQALPYMLEEDLATDVEKLHFSVYAKETDLLHVAICDKSKMQSWLDWLQHAEIKCNRFIPEGLALPQPSEEAWQAIQIENQWLVRESAEIAWSCEADMLPALLQIRLQEDDQQVIESYSACPQQCIGSWRAKDAILPMQLLAEGCLHNRINLLTGDFKVKKESNLQLTQWKFPAIAAVLLLAISLTHIFIKTSQIERKTELVKKQTEMVYKKAFPTEKTKYSRIKKKLKGLLAEINEGDSQGGFLHMLNELSPVFQSVTSLEVASLKYSVKKREISMSVSADSFQAFEQLSEKVPADYEMEKGTLNNSKNRVSGTLTVREK